ncbi:MAG: proteasome accessory factor PafA2 family protein [Candidatus Binatia bacterium]
MAKRNRRRSATEPRALVAKVCGADIELGNFVSGSPRGPCVEEASAALLEEIPGVPGRRAVFRGGVARAWPGGYWAAPSAWHDPQDVGRRFLPGSGACAYIDLAHLELCAPETLSAFDHVAAWHALLRVARRAQLAANARRPPGERIEVLVNNSDGNSNSFGSHLSFLLTRRAWDDLFHRRLQSQLFLAAYQASSIVFTGQGKVGAENGAPPVDYQLAQRADFFETLSGPQTTSRRPLVNSRDESLCGPRASGLARLHCIFFDNTLCQVATLLKVGVMQIILALIEAERDTPALILDDALAAVHRWSHDPTLRARARLLSGAETTAVELQRRVLDRAQRFVAAGGCDGIVPRAAEILALWADTLAKLAAGDWEALRGRLDWVLKRRVLERVLARRADLTWRSPALKHLDHLYASLDAEAGLYWACEREGLVQTVVAPARIARFVDHPPEDTRAWTRARLLRLGGREAVEVDWDTMTFEIATPGGAPRRLVLALDDPRRFTRAEFERRCRQAGTLEAVLEALGAVAEDDPPPGVRLLPAPTMH